MKKVKHLSLEDLLDLDIIDKVQQVSISFGYDTYNTVFKDIFWENPQGFDIDLYKKRTVITIYDSCYDGLIIVLDGDKEY